MQMGWQQQQQQHASHSAKEAPHQLLAFKSAPEPTSTLQMFKWPLFAAQMSAVFELQRGG
jgi:hypothetical protein